MEELAHAAMTVLDGRSTNEQRDIAQAYIDQFKSESPYTMQTGIQLSLPSVAGSLTANGVGGDDASAQQAQLRFFGLQLVEQSVAARWDDLDEAMHAEVKEQLLQLMAEGTLPLSSEHVFIRNKIGAVVAEVAVRAWPQRWPEFMDQLVSLCRMGPTQIDLVLSVLITLTEEVMEYNAKLTNKRRADLTKGLRASLDDILPFVQQTLSAYVSAASSGAAVDESHSLLVASTLRLTCVFASWIPLLKVYEADLLSNLCSLLHDVTHRARALECLTALVGRKGPKDERVGLLDLVPSIELLVSAVPEPTGTSADVEDDNYDVAKGMARLLAQLSTGQVLQLWGLRDADKKVGPPGFAIFVEALYRMTCHPSHLVASLIIPAWLQLFRHDKAKSHPAVQAARLPLLERLLLLLIRPGAPESSFREGPSQAYLIADFDTEADYTPFFSLLRTRVLDVVKTLAMSVPEEAVQFVAQALAELMQLEPKPGDVGEDGFLHANAELLHQWDGISVFWESVMTGALPVVHQRLLRGGGGRHMSSSSSSTAVPDVLRECLEAVAYDPRLDSSDPLLLLAHMSILTGLVPSLAFLPEALPVLLKRLFAAVRFREEEDAHATEVASAASMQTTGLTSGAKVRRKACTTIVLMCRNPAPVLIESLGEVLEAVNSVLGSPHLAEMQRRLLVEALLTACNAISDREEHVQIATQLLDAPTNLLSEGPIAEALCSPQGLVELGGLGQLGLEPELRMEFTDALTTLNVALRVTRPRGSAAATAAAAAGAESIVPSTCAGLGGAPGGGDGCFHAVEAQARALWQPIMHLLGSRVALANPENLAGLPQSFCVLLGMRRSDVSALLTGVIDGMSRIMTREELWYDRCQLWLCSSRAAAFEIIEACLRQGWPFEIPNFAEQVAVTLFEPVTYLDLNSLRLMHRHVVIPLARYAPRNLEGLGAVAELLSVFYQRFVLVLDTLWTEEAQAAGSAELLARVQGSAPSETLEMVGSKLLRDLTSDAVQHLSQVLGDTTTVPAGEVAPARAGAPICLGPIGETFFAHESVGTPVLQLLCASLQWPCSRAVLFAADILAQVTPNLALSGALDVVIQQLLPAAVGGLGVHGQHGDCQGQLLTLLTRIFRAAIEGDSLESQQYLLQLPGVDPEAFERAASLARGATDPKHLKKLRTALRTLLAGCIGINIGQMGRTQRKVSDIPEALMLAVQATAPQEEEEPILTLDTIFEGEL